MLMKTAMMTPLRLLAVASMAASLASAQQPAPAAGHGLPPSPEMVQMQQIEDRWTTAVSKRDQYGLELVLSPQFVDISAAGDVTTRNQQIARVFLKDSGPISFEQKVATVRMFGDMAIVSGTYIERKKGATGGIVDEKGIFTHVFQRVRSNWQCVNAQRTIVVAQVVQAGKNTSTKKSNAELPLHVPLLYPGAEPAQPPKP